MKKFTDLKERSCYRVYLIMLYYYSDIRSLRIFVVTVSCRKQENFVRSAR